MTMRILLLESNDNLGRGVVDIRNYPHVFVGKANYTYMFESAQVINRGRQRIEAQGMANAELSISFDRRTRYQTRKA